MKQLRDKGSVTRGWIGVQIQPVTKDIADSLGLKNTDGALVAEPQAEQPGRQGRHQVRRRDRRGQRRAIANARELTRRIGSMAPGNSVKLTVLKGGSERTRQPDPRRIAGTGGS